MQQLIDLLEEIKDYFSDRADVIDSFDDLGFQAPNKEMSLLAEIEPILSNLKAKYMIPEPTPIKVLVSECCGVNNPDTSFEEHGICPKCGCHTQYVSDEDRFRETDDLPEGLFTQND